MKLNLFALVVLLLLSCQFSAFSHASSNVVTANVIVICPFSLTANVLPAYAIGNTINLNYTLFTQAQCSIPTLQGSFALEYSGNNVQVLYDSLTSTATQTPLLYNIPPINSMTLARDSYKAVFDFSAYGTSNQSVQSFVLVSQSNIIITNFTVSPSSVSVGSPLTFTVNVLNDGELASGPIGMNIIITGPQSFTVTESASPLLSLIHI